MSATAAESVLLGGPAEFRPVLLETDAPGVYPLGPGQVADGPDAAMLDVYRPDTVVDATADGSTTLAQGGAHSETDSAWWLSQYGPQPEPAPWTTHTGPVAEFVDLERPGTVVARPLGLAYAEDRADARLIADSRTAVQGDAWGNYLNKIHPRLRNRPDAVVDISPADARYVINRGRLTPVAEGLGAGAAIVATATGAEAAAGLVVEGASWSTGLVDGGILTLPFAFGATAGAFIRRRAERLSPRWRRVAEVAGAVATVGAVVGAELLLHTAASPLAIAADAVTLAGYAFGRWGQHRNYAAQHKAYAKLYEPMKGAAWRKSFVAGSEYAPVPKKAVAAKKAAPAAVAPKPVVPRPRPGEPVSPGGQLDMLDGPEVNSPAGTV